MRELLPILCCTTNHIRIAFPNLGVNLNRTRCPNLNLVEFELVLNSEQALHNDLDRSTMEAINRTAK